MIRKISHAITKRWGSSSAKQRIWDSEYKVGAWTYPLINTEANEPLYGFLEPCSAGGAILDLGCGSGMTALTLKNTFSEYVGVDVSEFAIAKARATLSIEADRAAKVRFVVSDIFAFRPTREFSVILFRESIYYVPYHRIRPMLKRYVSHLVPGGVLVVRLCDRHRYKNIVKTLELDFNGKEVFAATDSRMSIVICSPR